MVDRLKISLLRNQVAVRILERRMRRALTGLADMSDLTYKPDIYSVLGIYRGNKWGIKPTIYSSTCRVLANSNNNVRVTQERCNEH